MTPARDRADRALWPVFVAYSAAFLLIVFASIGLVLAVAATRARGGGVAALTDAATKFALSAPGILSAALVSEATFLAVAIVTARLLGRHVASQLRIGPSRAAPLGYVAGVFGTAALSYAGGAAIDLLGFRQTGSTMEQISLSLAHATPLLSALAVLVLGVGPGIAEEAFFRGLLQTRLVARLGRWPGIVITSFLFGLVHLDRLQSPMAFLLGLYLGWTAERLGGIRPTMLAHAINNALFVAAACLGDPTMAPEKDTRGDAAAIAIAGVVFVLSATLLRSRFAVRQPAG